MSKAHTAVRNSRRHYVVAGLLLFLCFIFLLTTRLFVNNAITGDEPHYLLMDYSLVNDKDLDLKNNYHNQNFQSFYPYPLSTELQIGKTYGQPSHGQYSLHGIGLPLVLLPGYSLAQKWGAVVEMVLVATVVIWLTWLWVVQVVGNKKLATITAGMLTLCYYFNGLAGYIYPDMVVAGLILAALIILGRDYRKTIHQVFYGLILGLMVLLHFRNLSVAGPLLIILVYKFWENDKKLPWPAIAALSCVIAFFFLSLHSWFGTWNPSAIYPNNVSLSTSPLSTVPAMLFDSNRGLLIYNPLLCLIFVGLPIWYRRQRESFIFTAFGLLPSIGLLSIFNQWHGGFAPQGRYIIDFLPALMPAIAMALSYMVSTWQKIFVSVLLVLTLFVTVQSALLKPDYIETTIYRTRSQLFSKIQQETGIGFDHLLPNYSNETTLDDSRGTIKVAIGAAFIATLVTYGYSLEKNNTFFTKSKHLKAKAGS